jgi:DNA-binding NtrC family response regulator
MRILCIDDDVTFLTVYKSVIAKHGLPDDIILTAESGEKGIALLNEQTVDLIITDLVMDGMSGLEVLRHAKSLDPLVEVIVVTGQGSVESAVEAMRLGARDYLPKPINSEMLIQKIDNMRDLSGRAKEAENYRFAMEKVEENAVHTVADMEVRLDGYIQFYNDIEQIVNDESLGDAERIHRISVLLQSHEGNHPA